MLRNTSASNGPNSFTIQRSGKSKSESYACTIQRVALLNSREGDFRLAPASRWSLEWGGFSFIRIYRGVFVRRSRYSAWAEATVLA
jgi:hypothetical protein